MTTLGVGSLLIHALHASFADSQIPRISPVSTSHLSIGTLELDKLVPCVCLLI